MSNFKNELTNYQSIPRELIFDNTLSDRARFLFCYMASKPDNWDFYLVPMAKELGYSVGTLRKYISELVESGWLVRGEQKIENGKYGAVEYTLKSTTANLDSQQDKHQLDVNFPYTENTDTIKTRVGKKQTLKDNIYSKDRDNKEKRDFSFSFVTNPKIAPAFAIWCKYSVEQFKSKETRLQIQYNKLEEYSKGNADIALAIVQKAIDGGFDRFVPLAESATIHQQQKWE